MRERKETEGRRKPRTGFEVAEPREMEVLEDCRKHCQENAECDGGGREQNLFETDGY